VVGSHSLHAPGRPQGTSGVHQWVQGGCTHWGPQGRGGGVPWAPSVAPAAGARCDGGRRGRGAAVHEQLESLVCAASSCGRQLLRRALWGFTWGAWSASSPPPPSCPFHSPSPPGVPGTPSIGGPFLFFGASGISVAGPLVSAPSPLLPPQTASSRVRGRGRGGQQQRRTKGMPRSGCCSPRRLCGHSSVPTLSTTGSVSRNVAQYCIVHYYV